MTSFCELLFVEEVVPGPAHPCENIYFRTDAKRETEFHSFNDCSQCQQQPSLPDYYLPTYLSKHPKQVGCLVFPPLAGLIT